MKPKGWRYWSKKKKQDYALQLLGSARGKCVLSQALHYGIKSLKSVQPEHMQEYDNIEDMEVLQVIYDAPVLDLEDTRGLVRKLVREKVKEGEEQRELEQDD